MYNSVWSPVQKPAVNLFNFSIKQAKRMQPIELHSKWLLARPVGAADGLSECQELFRAHELLSGFSSSGHKRLVPCGVATLPPTVSSTEASSGFMWIYPVMDDSAKTRLGKRSLEDTRALGTSKRRLFLLIFWCSFFRETLGM